MGVKTTDNFCALVKFLFATGKLRWGQGRHDEGPATD